MIFLFAGVTLLLAVTINEIRGSYIVTESQFVGRDRELEELNALLKKKTASLIVVKGRRRVGKSRLIEEFIKKKKSYVFRGLAPHQKTTAQGQRDEFASQLSEATGLPEIMADDWTKLFALLSREVRTGRIIIVFDEISWMGSEDSNFTSKLKDAWDQYFKKNSKLILILCGSVSTWIDENIINSTAFYGRVSWTITLKELPLGDANHLLEANGFKGSTYEKFKILAVTGGIPWYIEQINSDFLADENIKRQCFTSGGVLVEEYDRIFKELFGKKDVLYKTIIKTLANGALEYDEISIQAEYKSSGRLSQYLEDLIKAGFISRDYTWNLKDGKPSTISRFRLSDNYLRFYLKYIEKKRPQIEKGQFNKISLSSFTGWETIMGLQFENLVINNRRLLLDKLNLRDEDILYDNPYIQHRTVRQKGCQIDYMIQTKHKNFYLCEIKFSRQPIRVDVIKQVQEKIKQLSLPRGVAVLPILIHVNGVTEKMNEENYFYSIIDFGSLLHDK